MLIKLTPDIEQALAEEAHTLGTTPEQLALDSLRERFVRREDSPYPARELETLADFLWGHIGVLHSSEHVPGGARMSEASGKKFTDDKFLVITKGRTRVRGVIREDEDQRGSNELA